MNSWWIGLIHLSVAPWLPKLAWLSVRKRSDCVWRSQNCGTCLKAKPQGLTKKCVDCRIYIRQIQWISTFLILITTSILIFQQRTGFDLLASLLLLDFLLLVSWTDLWTGIIPNCLTLGGWFSFLVFRIFEHTQPFWQYFMAGLSIGIGLALIAWLTRGMGLGDAKLMAVAGWVIGWPHIFTAFWLSTVSCMIYVIYRWLTEKSLSRLDKIPFAPHLAMGLFVADVWGEMGWSWYLSWFF
ncbi:prepilin peptidase [Hazenella coriacea]|uniref:Type IV leader peptidase family protein n=1 Tax=Hazenella coriacea TaxID=1179467 RepID=A0A4R3L9W9_9BACL|nr:A24 family peptidase [Hazenella coriacea]TCS96509.1 type IV leader peptidase family protein [Hazenella coriacea]